MLFLHNDMIEKLLTIKECIDVQEEAFMAMEDGQAIHRPRIDMYTPSKPKDGYYRWGTMEGWYNGIFAIRMKSDVITWPRMDNGGWTEDKYCVEPGTYCGLIMLFSSENGAPLGIINDGILQHMRVGAGAGLGVKHLSRKNSEIVGMLGSGGMARTYLEAFCAVRPIKRCNVYSPTKANREAFADEMSKKLGIEVVPMAGAREAVMGCDILSSSTDSMTPTFEASWLEPGMHIVNLSNMEISEEAFARFDVVIRQGIGGLKLPDTERIQAERGMSPIAWIAGNEEEMKRLPEKGSGPGFGGDWPDFCDLVYGRVKGRTSDDQVTFYHNIGNQGLQFAAVGGLALKKAEAAGMGRALPREWFTQDVRD
ncbi:MAG: Ornithine cyclodeaminase 2 [Pseudomonadota bacterium]|jgi:alanine dehydrogenase